MDRQPPEKPYLTKAELVAKTSLSAATIQRLKDQGRIPFFQPAGKGGRVLFPPDAIERLKPDGTDTTTPPVGTEPVPHRPRSGPRPTWRGPR